MTPNDDALTFLFGTIVRSKYFNAFCKASIYVLIYPKVLTFLSTPYILYGLVLMLAYYRQQQVKER